MAGMQGRQVAVSNDAPLFFHPSGSVIQAFHLHEGGLQKLLRGHIDTVNACCYNPITQVDPLLVYRCVQAVSSQNLPVEQSGPSRTILYAILKASSVTMVLCQQPDSSYSPSSVA